MILEDDVENRDPRQRDIEDGLAVLRRLYEIRSVRRNGGEDDPEPQDTGLPKSLPEGVPEITSRD